MEIRTYSLDKTQYDAALATCFDLTLSMLVKQGDIPQARADELRSRFTPMIIEARSLTEWLRKKLFGVEGDGARFCIVEIK